MNKLQDQAVQLAKCGHNLFINGPPGTGKSYTIKHIQDELTKAGKSVAITCTTGIACANFGNACTLHRWSGIHDGRYKSDEIVSLIMSDEQALDRIRTTDVLIVDEISMLSQKLFDVLVDILTTVRDPNQFLGGIQLIVSGDFHQLPPVPNKRYKDKGEYCFTSPSFVQLHKVTLTQVVRQNDPTLIKAIQKVAVGGNIDQETVAYIKSLERPLSSYDSQNSTKLFSTNDLVNFYNRKRIEKEPGIIREYISQDTGENRYLNEITAQKTLWLKEQCPVVLIRNLSDKLVNGLQGVVTGFTSKGPKVFFPKLNTTATIGKVAFSVFSPTANRLLASREQVPLLLAFALTVHKAQGMTLDRVEIDCQQMFRPGQLGVAMGRVRSSDGLRVINFSPRICLPQPEEIKGYLSTPTPEPVEDLSCCRAIPRLPEEIVEPFWFEDELEYDVPVTEEDLEDDFNDVIASLNLGDTDVQQLPDGFSMEKILKTDCITEDPVTAIQEQINKITIDLLSNNMRFCNKFCLTVYQELSHIMNVLEATPGCQISADKLTQIYAEVTRYQRTDNYTVACLLMFEKYPNFGGAHSFICTKLVDGLRKYLIEEKTKLYDEKDRDVHGREITEASKARIRYVAGYCVSSMHKKYTTTYRSNLFTSSTTGQQKYSDSKEKIAILDSLKEEEEYLKMFSTDKESLTDIDRRQHMTRGLVNVSDSMFDFSLKLCSQCLELLVDKNLNVHAQSIHQYCLERLQNSEQLSENFVRIVRQNLVKEGLQTVMGGSDDMIVREVLYSTVNKVHNIHSVFSDITEKFLMVMFNQFRKDLLHSFSVAKTMAHRKQILIRQQKKHTEKSLSFKTILEDKTDRKEMSHSLLRGLLMSNVNVLDQMNKKDIEKIGKAYGIGGKQNTKKADLIQIVKRAITSSDCMPRYTVLQESSTEPQPSTSTTEPQPSTSTAEPQPSTSTAEPQPSTSSAEMQPSTSSPEMQPSTSSECIPTQESPSHDGNISSSSEDELCGHCQKVGKEGIQWIQCSACLVWFHRNCAGLRMKKVWEKYQKDNVDFFCKHCR